MFSESPLWKVKAKTGKREKLIYNAVTTKDLRQSCRGHWNWKFRVVWDWAKYWAFIFSVTNH